MSNIFQTPLNELLFGSSPNQDLEGYADAAEGYAGRELLVPAELYLEPDFSTDANPNPELNRSRLEKLTGEKTDLIQQLVNGHADGNARDRIAEIDRELNQIFGRGEARFWPKSIGAMIEGNGWSPNAPNTQGWKQTVRLDELEERRRSEHARHDAEVAEIGRSTEGQDAKTNLIKIAELQHQLRLSDAENEVPTGVTTHHMACMLVRTC